MGSRQIDYGLNRIFFTQRKLILNLNNRSNSKACLKYQIKKPKNVGKFWKIFIRQVSTGSIIIYTNQKILYMSNWILRFENGFYKVLIDLRVIQFLCKIMRLIWKSDYVPFQFKITHGSNQNIHFAELYFLNCLSNVFFWWFWSFNKRNLVF